LIEKLEAEVILVSKNYLGSINHTLLSLELLKLRDIPIKALVFNGSSDTYSEDFIASHSGIGAPVRVPQIENLSRKRIKEMAAGLTFDL
jgi:dethiobiotin synthetase